MIFKDDTHLQMLHWHSLISNSILVVNSQFSELNIYLQVNAQTMTMYAMSLQTGSNSASQSFELQWQEQTVLISPISLIKLRKVIVKSHEQYGITYEFIAYWTQSSILFRCTETNNILRAVSSSEDAVFSMRTFTWSWCLPVSLCRSVIGLNIEPYGLHFITRSTLAFEADICPWWKGISIQWFSEPFFHLFLRILTVDIVVLVDVIDLSHQIIELGKYRDDGYCKMLIWNLKDGVIATFSCPRRLKELRFQWQ